MRKWIQAFFLLVFTFLFFMAADPLDISMPVNLFLRLDPLIALTSILASREIYLPILLSLITLVSALLFGRFFCGYICPLGILIDVSQTILPPRSQKSGEEPAARSSFRNLKYQILLFVIFGSLLGFNLVYLFDPISFTTRVYTFLLYPLTIFSINEVLDILRPLAGKFHWTTLYYKSYFLPVYYMNMIVLILFCAILLLNMLAPRFWCRNLCPLGGLLSLFSRWGIFKRQVSNHCNQCMKCRTDCLMAAIMDDPQKTAAEECIQCLRCKKICPQSAISFQVNVKQSSENFHSAFNLSKRGFLISIGAGALTALNLKASPFSRVADARLIRPPGSLPEDAFLEKCVRCSECMKVCPTNTLQPSLWEKGLNGLWSPHLFPRLAGCDQTCSLCGKVCPTGAIRSLPIEEKKHAKIGTAFIVRSRCLVWEQDKDCFICDEQCPYNAIVFKWQDSLRRPFIIENKCNGCGFCEEQCPVNGDSAIIVTPHAELRLAEGSYIEAAKEFELSFDEDYTENERFLYGNEETGEWQDQKKMNRTNK
jgi:MauM/NapG family ferredoxin protein